MADIYSVPNVTVFGANGAVQLVGVASADMISIAFSDEATVVEQHNSLNKVVGLVAHNQRYDLALTFYPLPSSTAASIGSTELTPTTPQTLAAFQAITMPTPMATVHLIRRAAVPVTGPDQLPTVVGGATSKAYTYVGGGSMNFTSTGLMTMTLPLRKWALMTPV